MNEEMWKNRFFVGHCGDMKTPAVVLPNKKSLDFLLTSQAPLFVTLLQKYICWTWPREIYLLHFTEKYLFDMAKVVYLLPPTPVLAHQRNRPHGGRRRPLHRQVQKCY